MAKILVVRFSALGDVVMTVPIVYALATQYPQHQITVLSRKRMAVYFNHLPENVSFKGIDLNSYKGFSGLLRLYWELRKEHFDYVADFHDVLRTKVVRFCFWITGTPVQHIFKGRKEKKELTREEGKRKIQLKTSFQRYADVLERLGFPIQQNYKAWKHPRPSNLEQENWIGIAPFAAHTGKVYPLDKMKEITRALTSNPKNKVYLFGGGEKEQKICQDWENEIPGTISVIGKLKQDEELNLISQLDVMVSMDSANMHMASLVGTPVVSIWGATHPFAGFMGWGQDHNNAIQLDMDCRPCSIFGNKPCKRGDYACLNGISPKQVLEHIEALLK
jgi:ADP-heptose:LPS heptosyltransferase